MSGVTSAIQTQLGTCMKMGVSNTVTADTTLTPSTYKFCGATVTEHGYLSGVTSSIQTQTNNLAPKSNPTFTGTVSIPGATCTAVLNFPNTMTLAQTLQVLELFFIQIQKQVMTGMGLE